MASLDPYEDVIREMVAQNKSYADISSYIGHLGLQRGSSERCVQRFCANHNISRRGNVSDDQLEVAVSRAINEVGYFVSDLFVFLHD